MTITTTCPAWCTFDHAKSEARYRELAALDGLSPDVLEADLAASLESHDRCIGKHVEIVSDREYPAPRIMVFVDYMDEMKSACEARAFAADLLAAADKLDEIEAAS